MIFIYLDAHVVERDYFNDQDFLISKNNNWSISPFSEPGLIPTDCGGVQTLGGLNVLSPSHIVEKTFPGLPPHYLARVRLTVLRVDSWEKNSIFKVFIDDRSLKEYDFSSDSDNKFAIKRCGPAGTGGGVSWCECVCGESLDVYMDII